MIKLYIFAGENEETQLHIRKASSLKGAARILSRMGVDSAEFRDLGIEHDGFLRKDISGRWVYKYDGEWNRYLSSGEIVRYY